MAVAEPVFEADRDTSRAVFVERFELGEGELDVGVKDVVDIAGHPTRLGSAAYDDALPASRHAEIVERLLSGGVRLVGKTNMHPLAYGVTGHNAHYETPLNPNHPGLIPGGSSSGSAVAVAAGLCDAAIGTDTGGSIRVPAACCGILGLKPTFGRISRNGLTPARSSLDCVGPLARSATVLTRIMSMLAPDWTDSTLPDRPRIAWLRCDAEPELKHAAWSAAADLDPMLFEVEAPSFTAAYDAGLTVIADETHAAFGHLLDSGRLEPDIARRLAKARRITPAQIVEAEAVRERFAAEIDTLLDSCDALALPTLGIWPPPVSEAENLMAALGITRLCRPFNLSGHPALSVPLPATTGRPAALQLVAGRGRDELLVDLAGRVGRGGGE